MATIRKHIVKVLFYTSVNKPSCLTLPEGLGSSVLSAAAKNESYFGGLVEELPGSQMAPERSFHPL